jgi:hypothetical protein
VGRWDEGTHLPSEQLLSSSYSVLGGDLEARAFALAQ